MLINRLIYICIIIMNVRLLIVINVRLLFVITKIMIMMH